MVDSTKLKWLSHKKMAENLYEEDKPRLISIMVFMIRNGQSFIQLVFSLTIFYHSRTMYMNSFKNIVLSYCMQEISNYTKYILNDLISMRLLSTHNTI